LSGRQPAAPHGGKSHGDAAQAHHNRDHCLHRVRSVSEKLCEREDDLGDDATCRCGSVARRNLRSRLRSVRIFSFAGLGQTHYGRSLYRFGERGYGISSVAFRILWPLVYQAANIELRHHTARLLTAENRMLYWALESWRVEHLSGLWAIPSGRVRRTTFRSLSI